jgi:UDP-3-O-[3-hydroxymyristoyl] glucosamine N-acyltransferase
VLAGRSTVTNDIHEAGRYGGYPLQPLQQAMKTVASIGHLNEFRRNLNRVMKHLHLTPGSIR